MLLHSIVYACRCARVQAEFEAAGAAGAAEAAGLAGVAGLAEPVPNSGDFGRIRAGCRR